MVEDLDRPSEPVVSKAKISPFRPQPVNLGRKST